MPALIVPWLAFGRPERHRLTSRERQRLELAEEAIAVDPEHRVKRLERDDGTVVDWNEPGVLIAYGVIAPRIIEFVKSRSIAT